MGNFITDVSNGKKPAIKNRFVLALKSDDAGELFSKYYDMAQNGEG